jgi:hypothetical protein
MKKKIFIDFDEVLNIYNGWQRNNELFKPMPYAKEFLKKLSVNFEIYIFTTRDREKVYKWMIKYFLDDYICDVVNKKEPTFLYIDDRTLNFDDDYKKILEKIENFKSRWKD